MKENFPARVWIMALGVVLGSIVIATALSGLPAFHEAENRAYDWCFLMRPWVPHALAPARTAAPITMVWIDTDTANALNKPMMLWPAEFGEVIRAAAAGGAKVVGLDYFFSYPVTRWDEAADPLFFKAYMDATQEGVPVILAYEREEKPRTSEASVPVYMQAVADGNVGYAEIDSDSDTFVRKIELKTDDGKHGSLALKIAAAYLGHDPSPGIPWIDPRKMAVNYYGARRGFTNVSMSEVLKTATDAAMLKKWFQGRIVLIGPDDLQDRHSTPMYLAGGLMEGTEIHANAISNMVEGDYLRPATAAQRWGFLAACVALAALAGFAIRWPFSLLAAACVAGGAFVAAVILHARGWILPVVPAELGVILATIGSYGGRLLTQDRHRALLEKTFCDMVSPEVLETILDAGAVPTESRRCEVTVMFSDIRGFTTYSEERDPQSVVSELNEYFAEMAECVMRHGGMVNKYIGDGMMALFGAPAPHPDHARRAVVCAMEMLTRLDLLNERRQRGGLEPWNIGIGIHTGDAVVGFVGARDRKLEYTANGDTVNVASRIEGLNKKFGTQILFSVATRERMGMDIATVYKGSEAITGRKEQEAVYTV